MLRIIRFKSNSFQRTVNKLCGLYMFLTPASDDINIFLTVIVQLFHVISSIIHYQQYNKIIFWLI